MTRTLRYLLLFVCIGLSGSAFAQEISGRVLDEKKEPLINAVIQVYTGGILKGSNITDYDGNYTIKPLEAGYYDMVILYQSYDSIFVRGVIVTGDHRTTQNFQMKRSNNVIKEHVFVDYKIPVVNVDNPGAKVMDRKTIARVATTQVNDLVATSSNVLQSQRGGELTISGARTSGTVYYIDGVQVRNIAGSNAGIDMAQGSVDQLEVITSGVSAKYGDFSGGVVNITSRGVAQKLTGDVRLQHSIDGYNNNLASFSIAGPLYKKKVKGEDGKTVKKPVLGFSLSGDFYDDHDRYPDFDRQYTATGATLKNLQNSPLHVTTDNSGSPVYYYSSNYVTLNDITTTKITPHRGVQEDRINGKLDYQVSDNMHIVAGGTFDYSKSDQYSRARNLFAPEATPTLTDITGRGYLRFTQKFGKANDTSSRHSIISNAYYTVQADYQKTYRNQEDPRFKENIFQYQYVGKFTETRQPIYFNNQTDSISGLKGTILTFSNPTSIKFDRSELNPVLANYTTQFYNSLNGNNPAFLSQIQGNNALLNGDEPNLTYGLFYSPGTSQSYYYHFNSNQYALTVDASFDLLLGKTKHAIGFGLYYQQRIEKQFVAYSNPYGYGAIQSLWAAMRQLVSSISNGNLVLDKQHPIFLVGGKQYTYDQVKAGTVLPGPQDTIIYNYKNTGNTTFDQNLRKKLGYTSNQDINIDALAPSTFSLDMFSADELLNSGRGYTSYYGYGYAGQSQPGTVNFNDFWTKKDANGNYTRPIGAFSPNYIAGYLLDKFTYKDVRFNIGLRIDRFSANTKVLIDPYSEYAEKTVGQVAGSSNTNNGGAHPANMGSNYVVYVDDNNSATPSVIGYRDGNNWYDPKGKLVLDPSVLKQYSGGRDPQPFLVKDGLGNIAKITDSSYNPNSAFTDYTPQVTLQPRLSFSFPISEVADFYAHYDIYSQRPTSNVNTTAADYYYLSDNANSIINNPNLKPQKTFDYEVGFQQQLSSSSSLTIAAFYKERKDMITVVPYIFAWPTTYYTYGNRDFSTTKGTTITYDMRATNHLTLNIGYTLQFAEGTGSTPQSTNSGGAGQISPNGLLQSFIQAGLPNLRYVTALDYDARHNIVANIDYRYGDGEGPVVGGKSILQNAGIDLIGKVKSGEPYTRYTDALGNTVIGGVAGSRLPWHYGLDLRIDKDFALSFGKRHKDVPNGVKAKRPLFLKAIIQANNVLQTRDILHVYGFTGRPDDNGYLSSSYGQQFVPQQINPTSYAQLYQINVNNPDNLNYARTISFALEFNF